MTLWIKNPKETSALRVKSGFAEDYLRDYVALNPT